MIKLTLLQLLILRHDRGMTFTLYEMMKTFDINSGRNIMGRFLDWAGGFLYCIDLNGNVKGIKKLLEYHSPATRI